MTPLSSDLRLRSLTDEEFDLVSDRAAKSIPLDQCPTCSASKIEVAPGVYGWENGTYRYRGQEYNCDCDRQRMLRKHYLLANIGEQYMRLDWNDYDASKELRDTVALYLDSWETAKRNGMGVTIKGSLGVGKTFAATHIGKELIKRKEDVYFTPFLEVVSAYQKQNAEAFERMLKQAGLLILDELVPPEGGPQSSLFARRFEELVRHRTNFNLPIVLTTNLNERELLHHYPRTYSLLAAKQVEVEIQTSDARRKKIAIENLELLANKEVRPIT